MRTIPDMSFDDHVKRLLNFVDQKDRSIKTLELRFFYLYDLKSKNNELYIEESNLLPIDKFERKFIELCTEGREWINISATSQFSDKIYGVEYDFSGTKEREKTAVIISGPNTDIEGNVSKLNIKIMPKKNKRM